eukprot:CAMPEP_0196578122 /NCGR_PEP_ID=MMETSP1081-20130531/7086_1 /TAXON_ID=36882 /ORGANISM="Pyramimonas amylifera, Strain CCMP720" /LENGTH=212 /DNA_ID=CAMNT_0041897245 /DNA_START=484 /DNA_END=1122 /DNA_ORIENTATION=+
MHFRWYPSSALLPCPLDLSLLRAHFFNSLKESTYILHGSASSVMQLSSADQAALWQTVQSGEKLDTFTSSIATLPKYSDKCESTVPVRLYFVDCSESTPSHTQERARAEWGASVTSWEEVTCSSGPVSTGEHGVWEPGANLGDALMRLLELPYEELFYAKDTMHDGQVFVCVFIHGIQVPLNTPLAWLGSELHFPDQFLHIAVRRVRFILGN